MRAMTGGDATAGTRIRRLALDRAGLTAEGLVAVLGLLAIASIALMPAIDEDYGWHVANGRNLLDGILLGGRDVYSWTAPGSTWIASEWMTDSVMAFLHDTFGPLASSLATALVVLAGFVLLSLRLRSRGHGPGVVFVTVAIAFAAATVSFGVRPQMLELLYLSGALWLLDAWFDGRVGIPSVFVACGIGGVLWANTHGSFLLLTAVFGTATASLALLRDRRAVGAAAATLIAAAAPIVNPFGAGLYGFAFQSQASTTTRLVVQEWQPPDLFAVRFWPFGVQLAILVAGGLTLALSIVLARWQAGRAWRLPAAGDLAAALLSIGVAVAALQSARHVMLLGIVDGPLVATALSGAAIRLRGAGAWRALSVAAGRRPRGETARGVPRAAVDERTRRHLNLIAALAVAAAVGVATWSRVGPDAQALATARTYPVGLLPALDRTIAAVPAGTEPHLLNAYAWGGFLLENRPGIHVFIDGRSEVYGDERLMAAAELYSTMPGWQDQVRQLGIDVALLPASSDLERALSAAGWRVAGTDGVGTILTPPGTAP